MRVILVIWRKRIRNWNGSREVGPTQEWRENAVGTTHADGIRHLARCPTLMLRCARLPSSRVPGFLESDKGNPSSLRNKNGLPYLFRWESTCITRFPCSSSRKGMRWWLINAASIGCRNGIEQFCSLISSIIKVNPYLISQDGNREDIRSGSIAKDNVMNMEHD